MSQYLGIVKKETIGMIGYQVRFITKTSSSKAEIEKWRKHYVEEDSIIIEYKTEQQEEIANFFSEVEDITPKTQEEKEKARKLYEEVMKP